MSRSQLVDHLVYVLRGGGAHLSLEQAVAKFPVHLRGARVSLLDYSAWQLLDHMRICQWDILEFSRDPKHVSPKWPEGCWPKSSQPPSENAWDDCLSRIASDLAEMIELISDPNQDLFAPFPHGDGQTLLREALLIADHNAYHLGQIVYLRKLLGCWE
ncbi:MAG: DinB family protein [Planctomycetota bacterium]